jgi:hypothetical protein
VVIVTLIAELDEKSMRKAASLRLPAHAIPRHNIEDMRSRYLIFAFFAAAMLFSIVREQCAPAGCPRLVVTGRNR